MKEINVNVAVHPVSYRLVIGTDLFPQIAKDLKEHPLGKRYAIITDSQVDAFWSHKLANELAAQGLTGDIFLFHEGEKSKNRKVKEELENQLLQRRYNRDSCVLALGGGVVGDLAGFVAATYMRGIPVVQIPTTTLSMADSSIGGKTGVDTPYGKNLIGAFHHPSVVYMDMKTLNTLDDRNYYSGLTELIKHGFIWDPSILDFVEDHLDDIRHRRTQALEDLFVLNCRVKNAVVSQDDQEKGIRSILNYGHTMGHAQEAASVFAREAKDKAAQKKGDEKEEEADDGPIALTHGEAVSIGIAFAARLALEKGLCSQEWTDRQIGILKMMGLPTELLNEPGQDAPDVDHLLRLMRMDKKNRDGQYRFVFTTEAGKAVWGVPVTEDEIRRAVAKYSSKAGED
ncbi:MAG TPA: 3-dehydroquinate synthase [Lachnospiraceae bacterium]|jgi:3-dehydroquinate synthase|nr:3-dehydroquinate synthase [Lachnospiraceae bacterium]